MRNVSCECMCVNGERITPGEKEKEEESLSLSLSLARLTKDLSRV